MKSIRLLPVVIFAALALLLFKGIGLVTNGGYVLTGTEQVFASGAAAEPAEATADTGSPTLEMPEEVTMADISPTLGDTAPTIGLKPEGEPGADAHGGAAQTHESAEDVAPIPNIDCPVLGSVSAEEGHGGEATAEPAAAEGHGAPAAVDAHGAPAGDTASSDCPTAVIPVNEDGDALATTRLADGTIVPLASVDGEDNEAAVLERLSARRADLDKFATDLELRAAIVEAAEKRLDERAAQMATLEAQISALVDQKQSEEDAQFKAVVSMYETMKPRDAAKIFNETDLGVLLRVARAMNPRKMAPVLAAMEALKAQALTVAMATDLPPPVVVGAGEDLANLPQIVGQ